MLSKISGLAVFPPKKTHMMKTCLIAVIGLDASRSLFFRLEADDLLDWLANSPQRLARKAPDTSQTCRTEVP